MATTYQILEKSYGSQQITADPVLRLDAPRRRARIYAQSTATSIFAEKSSPTESGVAVKLLTSSEATCTILVRPPSSRLWFLVTSVPV